MKLVKSFFVFTTLFVSITTVHAEVLKGCAAKKQAIETQLKHAQSRRNSHEISGLQKALIENTAYCNDFKLKQDREQKVLEKQAKVAKAELELQQAKESGKTSKVIKKQEKLKEAQQALNAAKTQLDI